MPTVHDVASYILAKQSPMTAMKLQKLVYYCQAWSLVWDERPLFFENIEAWANGPVVYALYDNHRGQYEISTWPIGNPHALDEKARETIDAVLGFYGDKSSQWLSDLTHMERPWREARKDLAPGAQARVVIDHAAMHEYYSSLTTPG
jgi:uncharacterized phage-associated protein